MIRKSFEMFVTLKVPSNSSVGFPIVNHKWKFWHVCDLQNFCLVFFWSFLESPWENTTEWCQRTSFMIFYINASIRRKEVGVIRISPGKKTLNRSFYGRLFAVFVRSFIIKCKQSKWLIWNRHWKKNANKLIALFMYTSHLPVDQTKIFLFFYYFVIEFRFSKKNNFWMQFI